MLKVQEEDFWWGRDVVMGEDLELGPLLPTIQLKEAGWQISWGPAVEPAEEGLPLSPLGLGLMKVNGTKQVPGDVAMAEEATDEETDSSLQLS